MNLSLRRAVARAARPNTLRTYPECDGSVFFLLLAALLLVGCASATRQVATHQNGYDFREARYEEACVVAAPPSECTGVYTELHAYEKHLHEAAIALKHGGGMPLQLAALRVDAKKLAKRAVAK